MPFNYDVFDCHCDTLTSQGVPYGKNHLLIKDINEYRRYHQVFAICSEGKNSYSHAMHYIKKYKRLLELWNFTAVSDVASLIKAEKGAILALEGADAIISLSALENFFKKGVRLLTLTWNNNNKCGYSIASTENKPITPFGERVLSKCEELGIIVDVSHLNDRGFYSVYEKSTKPFIVSHSDSRYVCDNKRNITDHMFKCLIERDGVLGINFYGDFLGGSRSLSDVIKHIEHFASLGGKKNIGLGSDFDGIDKMPSGCSGALFFYDIANELLRLNYSEYDTRNILSGNFRRIFIKLLPV